MKKKTVWFFLFLLVQISARPALAGEFTFTPLDESMQYTNSYSDGLLRAYTKEEDYKVVYCDEKGEIAISTPYETGGDFSEGLAAVGIRKEGEGLRYGYIDKTGELVIPAKFDSAYEFHEGLAAVAKTDEWGFIQGYGYIDTTGELVIPYQDYFRVYSFQEGLARIVTKDFLEGFMDKKGRVVIQPQYEMTEGWETWEESGTLDKGFQNGIARVTPTGNIFIDRKGSVVAVWSNYFKQEDGTGHVVPFLQALSPTRAIVAENISSYYSIVDNSGKKVVPRQYDYLRNLGGGYLAAGQNERYGVVDSNGRTVVPFAYDSILWYGEGFFTVELGGKLGFVDTAGNLAVPVEYDTTVFYIPRFTEGKAIVINSEDTLGVLTYFP